MISFPPRASLRGADPSILQTLQYSVTVPGCDTVVCVSAENLKGHIEGAPFKKRCLNAGTTLDAQSRKQIDEYIRLEAPIREAKKADKKAQAKEQLQQLKVKWDEEKAQIASMSEEDRAAHRQELKRKQQEAEANGTSNKKKYKYFVRAISDLITGTSKGVIKAYLLQDADFFTACLPYANGCWLTKKGGVSETYFEEDKYKRALEEVAVFGVTEDDVQEKQQRLAKKAAGQANQASAGKKGKGMATGAGGMPMPRNMEEMMQLFQQYQNGGGFKMSSFGGAGKSSKKKKANNQQNQNGQAGQKKKKKNKGGN